MKEYSYTSTLSKGICGLWNGETLPTLVVASKETGLEVNAHKTKYLVMSQDQNAEGSHSIKTNNSSFERVEEFKYGNNLNKSKFYSGRN